MYPVLSGARRNSCSPPKTLNDSTSVGLLRSYRRVITPPSRSSRGLDVLPSTILLCNRSRDPMLEEALREAYAGIKEAGINFVAGLPDGWQRDLHELIQADNDIQYVPVCNEG